MNQTDKSHRQRANAEGGGKRLPAEEMQQTVRKQSDDKAGNHDEQPIKWRFEFSLLGLAAHDFFVAILAIIINHLLGG